MLASRGMGYLQVPLKNGIVCLLLISCFFITALGKPAFSPMSPCKPPTIHFRSEQPTFAPNKDVLMEKNFNKHFCLYGAFNNIRV